MKYILFTFSLILCLGFPNIQVQAQSEILGTWLNTDKTAQIKIINNEGEYLGKITWLDVPGLEDSQVLDLANEDESLRDRPVMGLTILKGLTYDGEKWKGGEIYDPKSGKTYSCEARVNDPNKLELKGYIGFSWIGRTVEWTKVK